MTGVDSLVKGWQRSTARIATMMNGRPGTLLRRMASLPPNALSKVVRGSARQQQVQQLGGVLSASTRYFASDFPRSDSDGGGGGYRLRRPARTGGPPNPRSQNNNNNINKFRNKKVKTTTTYVAGVRGSRPHTITLFPGNYDDEDESKLHSYESADVTYEEDPEETKLRDYWKKEEEKQVGQCQKWVENSKPVERVSEIDEHGRSYGRGGRKTAEARVWIQAGFGEVVINHRPFTDYFDRLTDREQVLSPLVATDTCGKFDVQATVQGGGLTGQAGAIRLGLARALNAYNPDAYRPALKMLDYLTRDSRKVERKKVGHVKARKSPQWVRR